MVMSKQNCYLWWSSGKDSAWCLHQIRERLPQYQVTGLVTSINAPAERVAMHGVRLALLEAQADALGLPLHLIKLPHPCSNAAYEAAVAPLLDQAESAGISAMAFGDLFLQDIRDYRCQLLRGRKLSAIFPLWGEPTAQLARTMQGAGLRAQISCVDPRKVPATLAGAAFDQDFLDALPPDVDPCGENGEFHSFAWDGPMFRHAIPVRVGEQLLRDDFLYSDLLPASAS